jgi:hypothetical protein
MKFFALTITGFLTTILSSGCASKEKVTCPTTEQEPISVCRAKAECGNERGGSVGVGLGFGVTPNFGIGVGHNTRSRQYTECIDKSLKAQQENANLTKNQPTKTE